MTASKARERRCAACGKGPLKRTARAGRVDVYKGVELPIPAELPLVECVACGERYITAADAEKIDDALAASYTALVRARVETAIEKLQQRGVSIASVERELGLSEGYLSKIRKSVEPSFQLVALLAIIAENPKAAFSTIDALRGPMIAQGGSTYRQASKERFGVRAWRRHSSS